MKNNSQTIILGIESSCDDTAASVIINDKIRSNCIAGQEVHSQYGGVVPEWASRKHQLNIIPVVDRALKDAGVELKDLDAIACTQGPGLLGSLLVGYTFAKGLSLSLNKPLINVNHLEAHLYAQFIDDSPKLPFLCLLVSGGHTQLVYMESLEKMEIIGHTIDDAAGEAFDKAGKMLGLAYPSGPIIDEMARKGNPEKFRFAKPRVDGLNFSFSGFKTSVLYFIRDELKKDPEFIEKNLFDLCASIQHTIVSYLISKLTDALDETEAQSFGIAGGVAANSGLRKEIADLGMKLNLEYYIPKFEFCTDNAAMIAKSGNIKYGNSDFGTLTDVCYARNETT